MAVTVRRVQAANIAVNTTQTLYTCPVGKRAIIRSIHQGYDGGVVDASMGTALRGVGFLWDQKVSTWDTRIWPLSTVMEPGDLLQAHHTQSGQYTLANIVEMDAADAPTLWKLDIFSVPTNSSTQTYVVPAGKRIRVREVVIANHGDNADWQVYVADIGHILKVHAKARVGQVIGVNHTVNPGETIGAAVTGPSGHVFLSGVMEDA